MIFIQSHSTLNMEWISTLFVLVTTIGLQSSSAYEQFVAKIDKLPGDRPIVGGFLRRKCVGYPLRINWRYYWTYPDGNRKNGAYLTVNYLTKSQLGTYKCEATDGSNRLISFTTPGDEIPSGGTQRVVPVTVAPTVQLNINSFGDEALRKGGSIRRYCSVSEPDWNVYWTTPSGRRVNSPYLMVDSITASDAGQYTCHASNPNTGATRSKWFSFSIVTPIRLGIKSLSGDQIQIGGTIRRECLANKEGWDLHWVLPNGRRVNSRYLTINNLKASDAGKYTCFARQRSTGATKISWFEFQIPTASQNAIDIRRMSGERLTMGGQLRRECVVPGTGWNVYWNLPNGRTINGPYLVIERLRMQDIGRYTCHASNPSTGSSVSAWFQVSSIERQRQQVTRAALSMNTMPNQDLRFGGVLSQKCVVNERGWTIEWRYPDGRVINQDQLQVFNLSRAHYGKYWCVAKNPSTGEEMSMYYQLGTA